MEIIAAREVGRWRLGAGSFVIGKNTVVTVSVESTGYVDIRAKLIREELLGCRRTITADVI